MAKRMSTRLRMERQRNNAAVSRTKNGHLKRKKAATRDARMLALVKAGTFPYTPAVQSWLSVQLGDRFNRITEAQVKELVK
ncbi:hypothetical protein [Urbifossiella limnaea]|uniref:Uncharacterized protein n=1 Tax=Urbifossiella limnaea TaxID=2528023 RepID=A0A517Y118_9BACT|nr:hypothetical protein [Urbifossiella limnaea]QDU23450.1 hypothetical protein ETAA1_54500 [Urbifossiella limnaea]